MSRRPLLTPYQPAYEEFLNSSLPLCRLKRVELRKTINVVTCINSYAKNHRLSLRAIHRQDTIYLKRVPL